MYKEKLILVSAFVVGAPLLLLLNLYLYFQLDFNLASNKSIARIEPFVTQQPSSNWAVLSNKKKNTGEMDSVVLAADARPLLIKQYLEKYNSVLVPYSDLIFKESQKNGLDYRLIVAIAQQESNLCKKMPPNCFNCWGVGIHSRGTMCFESYEKAIPWFAKYLREEYIDKGMNTPEEIMKKYCPLSNGSWAFGVNQFMNDIK